MMEVGKKEGGGASMYLKWRHKW